MTDAPLFCSYCGRPFEEVPAGKGPFVGTGDPDAAQEAASATVKREGDLRELRPGTHRHLVLKTIQSRPGGIDQIAAGRAALREHGVGAGTKVGADVGRRRCTDLAKMGMIERVRAGGSNWRLSARGVLALTALDAGERFKVTE